ncbi:MAG: hypothetical protein GWO24_28160, partial [Akkermansiaceae bacterium]|nr:hypothetical protein [Akkermansiaceae bacterium]
MDANPYDRFETLIDSQGREIEDQVKNLPGLQLKTVREFDGNTERVIRATTYQNGKVRAAFGPIEARPGPDGIPELEVVVTPSWGLIRKDYHRLDGSNQGPVRTVFANGEETSGTDPFAGVPVSRRTERRKPDGTVIEETSLHPREEPVGGIPVDLLRHYKVGSSGQRRLLEQRAVVRGTDIALYTEHEGKRIYFDPAEPIDAPRFEIDLTAATGVPVTLEGSRHPNVTRIFRTHSPTSGSEHSLVIESVDLRDFFTHLYHRRSYDPAGSLVEEETKRLSSRNLKNSGTSSLLDAAVALPTERRVRHRFDPPEPESEGRRLTRIEVFEQSQGGDGDTRSDDELVLTEVLSDPQERQNNPYLPDLEGPWTTWRIDRTEEAHSKGTAPRIFFDGRDRPAVVVAPKQNARGAYAERIAYDLRRPESWQAHPLNKGSNTIAIGFDESLDFSNCHFLAFAIRSELVLNDLALEVRDESGLQVRITPPDGDGALRFWPGDGETLQWLPGPANPQTAATVRAEYTDTLIISAPELRGAGLKLGSLVSISLVARVEEDGRLEQSPLQRLATLQALPAPPANPSSGVNTIVHSSGLRSVSPAPPANLARNPTEDEEYRTDPYWTSEIRFQNRTIAKVRPRKEASTYPVIVVQDPSSPRPLPLYALVAESG